jgi:hypothetical protein
MAATVTSVEFNVNGKYRESSAIITGDATYTSGGYSITPQQFGMGTIVRFDVDLPNSTVPAIRAAQYDYTNNKLMFFDDVFAEIANGVSLAAYVGRATATGY